MARTNRKRDRKSRITIPTPEEIRARREAQELAKLKREAVERHKQAQPAGFGLNEDQMKLQAFAGTNITRDDRGKPRGCWRTNPFTALIERGTITQDESNAGMDLLRFYAASKGLDGPPEPGRAPTQSEWSKEDRRQYHIRLYAAVMARLTRNTSTLANAYAYALIEEDRPIEWRGIIERELQVTDRAKQVVRFQVMCEELIDAIPAAKKEVNEHYDRAA